MMKCVSVPLTEEQLRGMFRKCDMNRNGQLSKEELKEGFRQMGSKFPGWRASRALRGADRDGDGDISLSRDEFDRLVKYALKRGYTIH